MSEPAVASRRGVVARRFFRTEATAPGPSGPEMGLAFLAIRDNPLQFLNAAWRTYGDVVQFPIPTPPTYLVSDPAAVRRVLVGNARNYGKSTLQYRALSLVTGEGLLSADTPAWRIQRPIVQPAFHHRAVTRIADDVADVIGGLVDEWSRLPEERVVDVDAAMMHAALDIVGRSLFGTDLSADAQSLADATLDALDVVVARARVPITPPSWMPTPANRRLASAVRLLDGAVDRMVRQRELSGGGDTMLDLLLAARDENGDPLSTSAIRDQIVTFVVAGHETVASALAWSWSLLAAHPHVARRLSEESAAVLSGRLPQWDDLPKLGYARAVFDETLRLFPPAWLITRDAHDGDVLAGREVPGGSLVIMSPWIVHRHPALWSAPDAFDPDRFLGTVDRDAFLPFGAGPRLCIGRDFANAEGTLILAGLSQFFHLSHTGPAPEARPLVTIRPANGMPMRLHHRSSRG